LKSKLKIKGQLTDGTDEEIKFIREEYDKYFPKAFAITVSIIAITLSITAILFDTDNLLASIYPFPPTFKGAMIAVAFLVAWILFGIVIGYIKKKSFIKFLSLYWGIGGLLYLIGQWVSTTRFTVLKLLILPVHILYITPTYGLGYYYSNISFLYQHDITFPHEYAITSIILSWSAGAIGYLLGYLPTEIMGKHSDG